jgi:NitT/TauT family transport system ATP-binding protein
VEELRVGFERPRHAGLLTHPEFVALKRRCLQLLRHDRDSDAPSLSRLSPLGAPASESRFAA